MAEFRVNGARLQESLMELATIGATPGGGVTRLAASEEDRRGRDLLRSWFEAAGLTVTIDDVGNMYGTRAGRQHLPLILLGSHADTVVRGGKYDGALGVLGALEVIRSLNDLGLETERPIAVVNWTNEEGVRFEPAMQCSGLLAGRFSLQEIYDRTDRAGIRFEDALAQIGYRGDVLNRPGEIGGYLELHIEQGPVLESEGIAVGAVGGIVGITWIEVVVEGQSDHAGPSPMNLRHDALAAAAVVISGVERLARECDEIAVATVGRMSLEPNIINTIPGKVTFSVDFRHPEPAVLEAQVERFQALIADVAAERGVKITANRFWTSEPTPFAAEVVAAVSEGMTELGLPLRMLWSGAGHDAKYLAEICPSGMIFVRSRGGISHCEAEFSTPDDIEAGANVLLHATMTLANRV